MVVDGLEDIARLLNMSNVPRRIEGYDISHIQGFGAVVRTLAFQTSPVFCKKSPIFSQKRRVFDQNSALFICCHGGLRHQSHSRLRRCCMYSCL